jgi:hypothetical protein
MVVAQDGSSALLAANIDGNHCCAWDTANATIREGGKIAAVATSKAGKVVVSPVGALSDDGKTPHLLRCHLILGLKRSFYPDRLGTNIDMRESTQKD